ncbi:MAG: metal-sensing transcriptional repressor [Clostridia bacterium]|nr:metal-sensing transcriptional repressor [Clostridia bacterium]
MEQHTHEHTKAVLNRMSRAIGHMNAVKKMIEEGRDCSDVLIQLSAIKSEITGVSKVILKDHIDHCIVDAVKENDEDAIEQLKGAIDKLL